MSTNTDPQIEDILFAIRTALIALSTILEDRFDEKLLYERLEFFAKEADARGAESRFLETSYLLRLMAKNLPSKTDYKMPN